MTKTVLIVDDHPSFRSCAKAMLQAEGFDVVGEAENGVQALRAAKELHPDIVLLDVQLPDFDGFEVADRLQKIDRAPDVILTSSRDSADFGSLIGTSAARGFVPKADLCGRALAELLAA